MNRTNIEYMDLSWNPVAMRCTRVSEGCLNCWHLRMADRMAANPAFPPDVRAAYAGEGPPVLIEKRLGEPLHRRKPAVIGVQFMGDLFHEDVPDEYITRMFDVMADERCERHTFIVLTKRPEHIVDWENWVCEYWPGDTAWNVVREMLNRWPDNIWLGVTAENDARAAERLPALRTIPAAFRYVSVEPMLGAVRVEPWLDLVFCGFETGPGARRGDFAWARDLLGQCKAAGVPYFWKRAGPRQGTPPDLMVREWPGEA